LSRRWYRVGVRADGCRIELDGRRRLLAAYTHRIVEARDLEQAVGKALRQVARRLLTATLNPKRSPSRLSVVDVVPSRKPSARAPVPGLDWFGGA
jgi:hypothetical protein